MKRHRPVHGHKGIYYSEKVDGSRSYEVRHFDNGRSYFKTVGPKLRDALDVAADLRVKKLRGERTAPNRMTLTECIAEWRLHRRGRKGEELAPRTIDSYESVLRNHILPKLGSKQIQKLHPDDIAVFLHQLPLSQGTKRVVYAVLSDILKFAANPRRGYIPFNPCMMLEDGERPTQDRLEPRIPTPEEIQRLFDSAQPWLVPVMQTPMLAGLRMGETLGLRWQDIDFKEGIIHVRGQLQRDRTFAPTKGRRTRDIPLLPALRRVLLGQPTRFSQGYVFLSQAGTPMLHNVVSRAFVKARTRAGISTVPRELRFHDLRGTYASALLSDGGDIAWVSELLGHASVQTTMKAYWHVIQRKDRSAEAATRLGEALGSWAR